MKLTENIPFTYSIVEAKESADGRLRFSGIFQRSDVKNKNNRIYPRSLWEKVLKSKELQERIANRQMIGELDHPADGKGSLKNAACVTTKLELLENGDVYGEGEVLSTSAGKELRALMKDSVMVGISSRGDGTLKKNGEVDEGTYDLETFDIVGNPSTKGAYPKVMTEEYAPSNAEEQLNRFLMEMQTEQYDFAKMNLDEEVEAINRFNDRAKLARMYKTENPSLTDLCEDVKKRSAELRDAAFEDIRTRKLGKKFEETEQSDTTPAPTPAPAPVQEEAPKTRLLMENGVSVLESSMVFSEGSCFTTYDDSKVKIYRNKLTGEFFVQDKPQNKTFLVETYQNYAHLMKAFVKEDTRLQEVVPSTEPIQEEQEPINEQFEDELTCANCDHYTDKGCSVRNDVIETHGEEALNAFLADPEKPNDCAFWAEKGIAAEEVSEQESIHKDMKYEQMLEKLDQGAVSEEVNAHLMEKLQSTKTLNEELQRKLDTSMGIVEALMDKLENRDNESGELATAKTLINTLTEKLEVMSREKLAAEKVAETLLVKVQDTTITESEVKNLLRENPDLRKYSYILSKAKDRGELGRMVEDLTETLTEVTEEIPDTPAPKPQRVSGYTKEPLPGGSFRLDESRAVRSLDEKRNSDRAKTAHTLVKRIGGK